MRNIYKITIFSIIILLLSQAFMIVLISNSFEKIHLSSMLTKYAVPQKDFKRKVETGLRYGKELEHLLGIEALMVEYADQYDDLKNIEIYSPEHRLIYGLNPRAPEFVPSPELPGKTVDVPDPILDVVETETAYLIILPLFGHQESWLENTASSAPVGSIVFSFYKEELRSGVHAFWKERAVLGALIAVFASLLMFVFLFRIRKEDIATMRRYVFIRILGVTILAQLAFAGINAHQFHGDHILVVNEKVNAQLNLLRADMERILSRGIGLDRISQMDEFLLQVMVVNPEVASLSIRNNAGEIKARALKDDLDELLEVPDMDGNAGLIVSLPLRGSNEDIIGEIRANLDRSSMRAIIWKLLLDSLTIALIASLFITEQIYFLISRLSRRKLKPVVYEGPQNPLDKARDYERKEQVSNGPQEALDKLMLARFAAFIFLLSFALPISFVPLQMRELYEPLWGLPRNIVIGLPISLEMFCALVSSLIAGTLADKKDWRAPFVAGVMITAMGMVISALSVTGIQFILARGICGLGYGLSWMALQSFLFSHSTSSTRAQGSSHFVAGLFSGHICGTALGAILAERLGYSPVFVIGFFMALGSLIFFLVFMRTFSAVRESGAPAPTIHLRAVARYLMDRNAAALMFFCVIPFSICQVGLLFFATPLYLNEIGVSQSDIGRVLMIYGLSVVYLAPQLSKIVDRREHKKPFIAIGGLLGGIGLSLLFFYQGFLAIVTAIFLLGLASSIGSSAQTAYALKLRATKELGQGKAMAIQRAADKLGQMMGPLALGALMSGVSIAHGLVFLGFVYMIVSFLFLFLAREGIAPPVPLAAKGL